MAGSDEALLAEMEAFWIAFDAAETDQERHALMVRWHLAHGGRLATRQDVVNGSAREVGELATGLHPVRMPEI
jgi:hypothetical protein